MSTALTVEDERIQRRFAMVMDLLKDQQRASACPINANIPDSMYLYGRFKQATEGDVTTDPPSRFNVTGRAKWDARAACRGLAPIEAMRQYMDKLETLIPNETELSPDGKQFRSELLLALHPPVSTDDTLSSSSSPRQSPSPEPQYNPSTPASRRSLPNHGIPSNPEASTSSTSRHTLSDPSGQSTTMPSGMDTASASLDSMENRALSLISRIAGQDVASLVADDGNDGQQQDQHPMQTGNGGQGSEAEEQAPQLPHTVGSGHGRGEAGPQRPRRGRGQGGVRRARRAVPQERIEGSGGEPGVGGEHEGKGDGRDGVVDADIEQGVGEAVSTYESGASHTDTVHTLLLHLAQRDREIINLMKRIRTTVAQRHTTSTSSSSSDHPLSTSVTAPSLTSSFPATTSTSSTSSETSASVSSTDGNYACRCCGRSIHLGNRAYPTGWRGVVHRIVRLLKFLSFRLVNESVRAVILIVIAALLKLCLRRFKYRWPILQQLL